MRAPALSGSARATTRARKEKDVHAIPPQWAADEEADRTGDGRPVPAARADRLDGGRLAATPAATASLDPSGSWHGRAIERPNSTPPSTTITAAAREAGVLRTGAGLESASGSPAVRRVQRMLHDLGYGTGRIDGRFGPRTRSAVGWFQRKHALAIDGAVGPATLSHLQRRAKGGQGQTQAERRTATPPASSSPTPSRRPSPSRRPARSRRRRRKPSSRRPPSRRPRRTPGPRPTPPARTTAGSSPAWPSPRSSAASCSPCCCAAGAAHARRRAPSSRCPSRRGWSARAPTPPSARSPGWRPRCTCHRRCQEAAAPPRSATA